MYECVSVCVVCVCVCVCVVCVFWIAIRIAKTLSSASRRWSVWKISLFRLHVGGLDAKIDKELCPRESTGFGREDPRRRRGWKRPKHIGQ